MEDGILQWYVYTKEMQWIADVFQDLSKILDYGMGAVKFGRGVPLTQTQHAVHIWAYTYAYRYL